MKQTWPFQDSENAAVITIDGIMRRVSPVLWVTHDEDDGMWQFLDGNEIKEEEARILSLKEMVSIDPSLTQLSDLPLGRIAWRVNQDSEWIRAKR